MKVGVAMNMLYEHGRIVHAIHERLWDALP
jgi:hypothetical protein